MEDGWPLVFMEVEVEIQEAKFLGCCHSDGITLGEQMLSARSGQRRGTKQWNPQNIEMRNSLDGMRLLTRVA
jgi:hypothetical protein